jgi:hypothetical protein
MEETGMGISAITRKDQVAKASGAGALGSAAALSLSADQLALSRRDGGPERPPIPETPGLKKMGIGGTIAAVSIVGLGLTMAAVTAPWWVPAAFGVGVLVGGAILLRGAKEWADSLAKKLDVNNMLKAAGN